MKNNDFRSEILAILDPFKTIFKMSAAENENKQTNKQTKNNQKQRHNEYFYKAASTYTIYPFSSYR